MCHVTSLQSNFPSSSGYPFLAVECDLENFIDICNIASSVSGVTPCLSWCRAGWNIFILRKHVMLISRRCQGQLNQFVSRALLQAQPTSRTSQQVHRTVKTHQSVGENAAAPRPRWKWTARLKRTFDAIPVEVR